MNLPYRTTFTSSVTVAALVLACSSESSKVGEPPGAGGAGTGGTGGTAPAPARGRAPLDELRRGAWLVVHLAVLTLLSWLGTFGGSGHLGAPWDSVVVGAVALAAVLAGKVDPCEDLVILLSGGNIDPALHAAVIDGVARGGQAPAATR